MPTLQTNFHHDGFAIVERAIEPASVRSLREAALQIVDAFDLDRHRTVFRTDDRDAGRDEAFFASATGVHCFLEAEALDDEGELVAPKREAINKIGHALHDRVPAFGDFCRRPVFGELFRAVGMTDPLLVQTMFVFKQPRIGGEVRWHQDASYLITRPAGVVGLWIALEDAHRENGCLWMVPGGHRGPLRELYTVDWQRRDGRLRTVDETPWPGLDEAVPLEVPAGSVVLFHDHMPHRSDRNESAASRHALTLHAAERGSTWVSENWLQRQGLADFEL